MSLAAQLREKHGADFANAVERVWLQALEGAKKESANRAKLVHFLGRAEESPQAPDCEKHKDDKEEHLMEMVCKLALYAPEEWSEVVSGIPAKAGLKNDFKVIAVAFDASSRLRRAGIDFYHWRLTESLHGPSAMSAGFPGAGYVLHVGVGQMSGTKKIYKIGELPQKEPGTVRLVAVSDTHHFHGSLKLPEGDILLHAGDLSYEESRSEDAKRFEEMYASHCEAGSLNVDDLRAWLKKERLDVVQALEWLGKVGSFKHRVLIGGNHDYILDRIGGENAERLCYPFRVQYLHTKKPPQKLGGLTFWGSGISFAAKLGGASRAILSGNNAFQIDEEQTDQWLKETEAYVAPGQCDVVLTHQPPVGLLAKKDSKAGNAIVSLVERLQPKLLVCGHAHHPGDLLQGTVAELAGGAVGVNAACLGVWNQLHGLPIVVDLPSATADPKTAVPRAILPCCLL